jgi:ribosomal protein S27AE
MAKKTSKSKTTVNVDAVRREARKMAKEAESKSSIKGPGGNEYAELAPGSVNRQSPLEKEMGTGKYRDMIHEHNDKNKHILDRLPFQFPKKKAIRSHLNIALECPECQETIWGSEHTVGVICGKCHKYVAPKNPEAEARGYDPDTKVGFRGTATDLINLRDKKKSH